MGMGGAAGTGTWIYPSEPGPHQRSPAGDHASTAPCGGVRHPDGCAHSRDRSGHANQALAGLVKRRAPSSAAKIPSRRMPDQHPHAQLIREFHAAQNDFYADGDQLAVAGMLTDDVAWHVPGRSVIAGSYRGRDEVLRYFARRRELSASTFRIDVRGVLADDERAVILAESRLRRGGDILTGRTVVIFRILAGKIGECWVVPYDQLAFDDIWSSACSVDRS